MIKSIWARARRGDNVFFVALIILHLLPLWSFRFFPTQDGPAHLYNANVLREYRFVPVFKEYYVVNSLAEPNSIGHFVLAGLMYVAPPLIAEKIFLSAYVIALPVAARFALAVISPEATFLSVLSFPFIYNFLLHMGFYNYSCGLPLFLLFLGYWMKCDGVFKRRDAALLIGVSLLLYVSHIFALAATYLAVVIFVVCSTGFDVLRNAGMIEGRGKRVWSVVRSRLQVSFLILVPALALGAGFLITFGLGAGSGRPLYGLVRDLYHLSGLTSYELRERLFSTPFAVLFLVISAYFGIVKIARRQLDRKDGLLIIAAVYLFIYLFSPDTIGSNGGFIKDRIVFYLFLTLILWFGAQSFSILGKRFVQVSATIVAIGLLGLHMQKYRELNGYLEEYTSANSLIEPNTTLLPLHFSPFGHAMDGHALSTRVAPFTNASGYVAADRKIVDLLNYEAATNVFPIIFRPQLNPLVHLWHVGPHETQAQFLAIGQFDFSTYPARTGGRIDYVLVWHTPGQDDQAFAALYDKVKPIIDSQLREGYDLIYTSPLRGYLKLYRRKDWEIQKR